MHALLILKNIQKTLMRYFLKWQLIIIIMFKKHILKMVFLLFDKFILSHRKINKVIWCFCYLISYVLD